MTLKTLLRTTAAIAALAGLGVVPAANAIELASETGHASVFISELGSITEIFILNFGTILKPDNTFTSTFTILPDDLTNTVTESGPGNGFAVPASGANRGRFDIVGPVGSYTLVLGPATCPAGLTLDVTGDEAGYGPFALPDTNRRVGGVLDVTPAATPLLNICTYTVTSNMP
jgi:hypothetical protein